MGLAEIVGLAVAIFSLSARARFPAIPHWASEGGLAFAGVVFGLATFSSLPPPQMLMLAGIAGLAYSGNRAAFFPASPDTRYQDLAEFHERAAHIQNRFRGTYDESELKQAQEAWAAEVCAYLRDRVGTAQANRFEFAKPSGGGPVAVGLEGARQYALMVGRRQALSDIMGTL